MRRLSTVLLSGALVASLSAVALAESGPKVSGLVQLQYDVWATQDLKTEVARQRVRLDVSGSARQNVDYYLRVQQDGYGTSAGPGVRLGYVTLKNVGVEGFNLSFGRQPIAWSILQEYNTSKDTGFYSKSGAGSSPGADAISASFGAGALRLDAFHAFDDGFTGARVRFGAGNLSASAQVVGQANVGSGWGVNGQVDLGPVTPYVELGSKTDQSEFRFVGANLDVLKDTLGVAAYVEYDLKGSKWVLQAGRDVLPGLNLAVRVVNDGKNNTDVALRTQVTASF